MYLVEEEENKNVHSGMHSTTIEFMILYCSYSVPCQDTSLNCGFVLSRNYNSCIAIKYYIIFLSMHTISQRKPDSALDCCGMLLII